MSQSYKIDLLEQKVYDLEAQIKTLYAILDLKQPPVSSQVRVLEQSLENLAKHENH